MPDARTPAPRADRDLSETYGRAVAGPSGEPGQGATDGVTHVVAEVLRAPARLGPVRLVTVDGPAGSGKTTTAARVRAAVVDRGATAGVVHMDDLYAGWRGFEPTLWPRVRAQVLEPVRRDRPGRFQRYDWVEGRFADWVDVPVCDVLVLEGCGSCPRPADAVASVRVWVEAPPDVRLRRGLARDGEQAADHWRTWMQDEQEHFATEGTPGRCDVTLDGFGMMVR